MYSGELEIEVVAMIYCCKMRFYLGAEKVNPSIARLASYDESNANTNEK